MPAYGPSPDRVKAFRNAHRVGQRLSGRLLRWLGKGQGLVNIQGHELTALIASNPEPGQNLQFVVESLYPNVVLRELHGGAGGGPSPAVLLADFRLARMEADETLKRLEPEIGWEAGASPLERKKAFHRAVSGNVRALTALTKLMSAVTSLNSYISPVHGAKLSSPSWLLPGASSEEFVWFAPEDGRTHEAQFFFYMRRLGRCELRLYHSRGKGGFRLLMEEPAHRAAISRVVESTSTVFGGLEFQGTGAMPPESRAGILARILSVDLSAPFSFDRRV